MVRAAEALRGLLSRNVVRLHENSVVSGRHSNAIILWTPLEMFDFLPPSENYSVPLPTPVLQLDRKYGIDEVNCRDIKIKRTKVFYRRS